MRDCHEYELKMNMYLDGELPISQVDGLLRHIEACGDCQRQFEMLKTLTRETRLLDAAPPADLHERIMKGVRAHTGQTGRKRLLRPAMMLAACAALAVLIFSGKLSDLSSVYLFGRTAEFDSANAPPTLGAIAGANDPESPGGTAAERQESVSEPGNSGDMADEQGTSSTKNYAAAEAQGAPPYALPDLEIDGVYAFYLVFTAVDGVPDDLALDTARAGDGKPVLMEIEVVKTERAIAEVTETLIECGCVRVDVVSNLPPVDESAQTGLILVLRDEGE